MKKRILIFSLAYHPVVGGAEIAVKEITDRIPEYEFDMITLQFEKSHPQYEQIGNIHVHRLKSSKIRFPIDAALFARKLHRERKYDASWAIMAARAGGACLFFKYSTPDMKYVLTLQEGDPVEYMLKRSLSVVNPFFKRIFTQASLIQSISSYLEGYARAMGYKGPVAVIPNGVDRKLFETQTSFTTLDSLKKELGINTGDTVLITTSRLVKKNAIDDCIKALTYLPPTVRFLVLGTGPDQKELESLVRRCGVADRVQFLGFIEYARIPEYLHLSDIFIRPSIMEGFGNSFIEAMAAGLPVIATPVGGITDFLFDPEKNPDVPPTGLFAEVKNPESIARAVERLLSDKVLRESIVSNAQKMVKEKYEWDLVSRDMKEKVFDCITEKKV